MLVDGLTAEYAKLLGENDRLRAEVARQVYLHKAGGMDHGASSTDHPFGITEMRNTRNSHDMEIEELLAREGLSPPASPEPHQQQPPMPEGHCAALPPPGSPPLWSHNGLGDDRCESKSSRNSLAESRLTVTPPPMPRQRNGPHLWGRLRDHFAKGDVSRSNPKLSVQGKISRHSEIDVEVSDVWKKKSASHKKPRNSSKSKGTEISSSLESFRVEERPEESHPPLTRTQSLKRSRKHVWHADEEKKVTGCLGGWQRLIVKPDDKRHLAWDLMSLVILSYDILGTPMDVFNPPETSFGKAMEITTLVFWTIDIIVTFFSGYHTVKSIEMRPTRIACHYLKTWFILDFTIVMLEWLSVGEASILRFGKFARGFRVIRLLRILKVQILFEQLNDFIRSETTMMVFQIGRLVAFILVINHFVACGWWGIGTLVEGVAIRWTDRVKQADDGIAYAYLTSLHWALTQFTPASMEVTPTNVWERTYTIFILMMGLGAFSSFLASISSLMTQLRQLKAQQHKEDVLMRRYLMEHGVSLELGNHILFFFRENRRFTKRKRLVEQDVKAFEQLPDSLRIKLHWEVYEPVILPHPLFFNLSSQDPSGLVEISHRSMNEKILGQGHELFHFGKTSERMYFVGKGLLDYVPSQDGAEAREIPHNHWLSEMVLWMNWIHRGTVSARENSELVELDSKKFHEHVRHRHICFEICRHYARLYVQRIAEYCDRHSDEELPPDYWGDLDSLQTIVHETSEGLHKLQRSSVAGMLQLLRGAFVDKDGGDNKASFMRAGTFRRGFTFKSGGATAPTDAP